MLLSPLIASEVMLLIKQFISSPPFPIRRSLPHCFETTSFHPFLGLVPVDAVFEVGLRRIEALERRSMPST